MNKTNDDLYIDLIAWIRLAIGDSGFVVIESHQRGKAPAGPYATLLVTSSSSVGTAASFREFIEGLTLPAPDGAFGLATSTIREVMVSLQFYRTGAHDNMQKVMHYPATNASKEYLFNKGISIFYPFKL